MSIDIILALLHNQSKILSAPPYLRRCYKSVFQQVWDANNSHACFFVVLRGKYRGYYRLCAVYFSLPYYHPTFHLSAPCALQSANTRLYLSKGQAHNELAPLSFGSSDGEQSVHRFIPRFGNVKKCAVGKHPKSEKHGNTAQFSEVERSGTQENCGGIGSGCRLRLRPLPVLHRRQSQRVARIDPNAVVVDKNIAENDRFDLFSR